MYKFLKETKEIFKNEHIFKGQAKAFSIFLFKLGLHTCFKMRISLPLQKAMKQILINKKNKKKQ